MNKRTPVTPADLFVMLDREFRRRKPRECAACFVQLPYRVDTLNGNHANWELMVPLECSHGCAIVLEEIVGDFQTRYELEVDGETA